jgi:hypothetical protein
MLTNSEKLIDICIPVLNDLEIRNTLDSILSCGLSEISTICISDNVSENPIEQVVSEFSDKLDIRYSRTKKRLSYEMNFVQSGLIGSAKFLTFCGAGDILIGQDLQSDISLLNDDESVALLGSTQLVLAGERIVQIEQRYDTESIVSRISRDEHVDWVFNGPLSGIGSWVIRRTEFQKSLTGSEMLIDGTAFPHMVLGLHLSEDQKVVQTSRQWYVGTYELDKSRMKNSIYQDVEWISKMAKSTPATIDQQQIDFALSRMINYNIVGFKAFGGKKVLRAAMLMKRSIEKESLFFPYFLRVVDLAPKSICFVAVYLKRKLLIRSSKTVCKISKK